METTALKLYKATGNVWNLDTQTVMLFKKWMLDCDIICTKGIREYLENLHVQQSEE